MRKPEERKSRRTGKAERQQQPYNNPETTGTGIAGAITGEGSRSLAVALESCIRVPPEHLLYMSQGHMSRGQRTALRQLRARHSSSFETPGALSNAQVLGMDSAGNHLYSLLKHLNFAHMMMHVRATDSDEDSRALLCGGGVWFRMNGKAIGPSATKQTTNHTNLGQATAVTQVRPVYFAHHSATEMLAAGHLCIDSATTARRPPRPRH
eukprot:CAMPEP_0119399414 /NCGR_PEP_ID=MMETSP1334-20130426/141348_1 /TAXON_ID=127549 /ORGANISM="Calcidiscus leptoporus, Strain RCC1130" /LENGTH=208 /DNA_ID=CAMNT_0007423307 /DNA_START=171 /DNA_END=800 /DNA_ORIENTATION=-